MDGQSFSLAAPFIDLPDLRIRWGSLLWDSLLCGALFLDPFAHFSPPFPQIYLTSGLSMRRKDGRTGPIPGGYGVTLASRTNRPGRHGDRLLSHPYQAQPGRGSEDPARAFCL